MEFHEKMQELRRQKGLTQEELAELLYVSRTAVSKWESGRGYPGIDSLKAIAKFFSVTVDELLSGEELLSAAEEDRKQKEEHLRDLVFGLLDLSTALLLFLPFFGQQADGMIRAVSLLALTDTALYLRAASFAFVAGSAGFGVLTLVLQTCRQAGWIRLKRALSFFFSVAGTLLFILGQQPYAAVFLFVFCMIKVLLLVRRP